MEKIKYIDDNQQKGILIDWKKVSKRCKELDIPSDVYTPFELPFTQAKYFVEMSERSIGKTTNWLLLGMILNDMYGITIQYVRQILDMIMPKNMDLFRTILEYDYIEKITNGRYNSVKYFSRRYFYINTNTGEEATESFMNCLSIDQAQDLKSSYNAPLGDIIIFDEFISKYNRPNEFVEFEDLVKTIIRERESPIVVLLANTIDRYNIYFKELEIYDDMQNIKNNEKRIVKTAMGTVIHINLIANVRHTAQKEKHNSLFFGFKNEKLNAIRGGEWATNSYQHIPRIDIQPLVTNRYINFNGKFLRLELIYSDDIGRAVFVHEASQTYEDSIIYTTGEISKKNERYLLGDSKIDKYIWMLYTRNKFYYSNNMVGEMVNSYVRDCKFLKR